MVIDLKRKLLKTEKITRMCGQSKAVHGNDPLVFRRKLERYMDSSSEVGGGSFWSVKSTTSPANVRLGVDSDGISWVRHSPISAFSRVGSTPYLYLVY